MDMFNITLNTNSYIRLIYEKTYKLTMGYSKIRLLLFITGSLFNIGLTNKMSLAVEGKLSTSTHEITSAAAYNKPKIKYEDANYR